MAKITLDIPDNKVQMILDAFAGLYPIPEIPQDPNIKDSPLIPQFTKAEWAKRQVRHFILREVMNYQKKVAHDEVERLNVIDESLIN